MPWVMHPHLPLVGPGWDGTTCSARYTLCPPGQGLPIDPGFGYDAQLKQCVAKKSLNRKAITNFGKYCHWNDEFKENDWQYKF